MVETSYGERRRLELAMALAQKPKVLLLDEPLAGLSQGERQTVRELLDKIPRDVTIVMIEHDMDTALDFAERITAAALRRGDRRRHARRGGRRSAHPGGLSWRLTRCDAHSGIDTYYGDSHVLHGVGFTLQAGRLLGLLGRNGAGKTTCMSTIMGFLKPRAGTIALFGEPVAGLAPETIARKGICLVPQGRRMFRSLTVRENLMVAAQPREGRRPGMDDRARVSGCSRG